MSRSVVSEAPLFEEGLRFRHRRSRKRDGGDRICSRLVAGRAKVSSGRALERGPERAAMAGKNHDALFRQIFSNLPDAAGLLRSVLPQDVLRDLDLATIRAHGESFVDENLRGQSTDLLLSVDGWAGRSLVYVLFEHQSTVDRTMPLRMLRYVVAVHRRSLEQEPDPGRIPPVIPIVVYHGPRAWNGPTSLEEISTLSGEAVERYRRFLPSFRFLLVDLSRLSQQELARWPLTPPGRLALALLKDLRHREDLLELIRELTEQFAALGTRPPGEHLLQPYVVYICNVRRDVDLEALADLLGRQLGRWAREEVMSTADQLIEQGLRKGLRKGRQEGRHEGRQEGRQEGRVEEARDVLLRLMERRFGAVSSQIRQRVEQAELVQVRGWIDRLFEASSAEDLLGE